MPDMNKWMEQDNATRLAAALEQYDKQCEEMVRTWLDMDRYVAVSALVDEIRMYCGSLPGVSAAWVAFLISHCDLVFCLYQVGSGCSGSPEVQARVRHHAVAQRNLRQSCARMLAGDHGGPASPLSRWNAPPR